MTEYEDELNEEEAPMTELERLLRNYEAHDQIYPRLKKFGIKRLTTIQYFSIIWDLFQGTNLLLSAATSAGKTLVGEVACVNAILKKGGRCLYLVPLKSLANEKLKDFREHWEELGVEVEMSTGDLTLLDREAEEEKLKTVKLLITTYERADSILRSNPDWFGTVKVVVVDEIHNIASPSRGARLEGLIIRIKTYFPSIQFIYLSATIGNPEDLASWLDCTLIKHDHRPVPLEYQIAVHPNRNEKIREIVRDTLQKRGSLLIFTLTRYEAEQLCSDISQFMKEQELLYLVDTRELRATVNRLHEEIGAQFDQRLFYSIPRGVAFHHAGLSHSMRTLIEQMFREGRIKIIVCTPTLSSGVNLPAKVVVIKDVGLTRSYLLMKPNTLHQMCGRAGRPGYDDSGQAIILATRPGEKSDVEILYFQSHSLVPKHDPIESQFMDQETLLEQFLIWIAETPGGVKEADLQKLTFKTFWYAWNKQHNPDMTIRHLTHIGHYSLENLLIRHSSPQILREARSIPDEGVTIRQMDPHKMEAIVFDRFHIKTSFSKDHPDCGCGLFDYRDRRKAKLCRHLVKLALVGYKKHPSYVKDIVLASLHEEQLIDRLLKYSMIKIMNTRLHITEFGRQTFLLYLRPKTAYWIRRRLPRIDSKETFYHDLLYAYDMERNFRMKAQFQKAIVRLFEDTYTDLLYHMEKIESDLKIHPGDMEEFVKTLRWILYCFHTLAELDQDRVVLSYTEPALDKLIPSPEGDFDDL